MRILREAVFLTFRWIFAALLFNAVASLLGGLMLATWYWVAEGLPPWSWLRREFGEYFFKTFVACLAMMLIYPGLQRGMLILFRRLIDRALMSEVTTQLDNTPRTGSAQAMQR
ncbi:MAG: hypothetical protein RMM08_09765 [Armatimonadota bacterium]|nr:hypothetical protein [bacterium]MDW8321639.1 hypothetical protein [Armatimonadota bacterium]